MALELSRSLVVLLVGCLILLALPVLLDGTFQPHTRRTFLRLWRASTPLNKAKVLLGFYFIAARVEAVYEIVMLARFAAFRRTDAGFSLA